MAPTKRYAKKQANAIKRRRLKARKRLEHERAQARQYIKAIYQALEDLGLPETLVAEIEGRLRAQQKLMGKIVGLMFPTLFGCRHPYELTCVRGAEMGQEHLLSTPGDLAQAFLAQTSVPLGA